MGGVTGRFCLDSYICTDFRTRLGQYYVASLCLDLSLTSMNLCVSLSTRYMSFLLFDLCCLNKVRATTILESGCNRIAF